MVKKGLAEYVTVDEYLDTLNESLSIERGRIVGEVSGLQLYPGRNYLFFSIKDKESDAVMKCFMWKREYTLSGIDLEDGLEIIISGYPKIYKPNGSLTFQTQTVELVGEGALKKAYDKLRATLEKEGLFADGKKRRIPIFPHHIGLITSKDGAAIGDFLMNLGKFGFKVSMIDSRVEGQLATEELLNSILTFKKKDIDVLVIIRGGGSLESFLPFNNEVMVRTIAEFPVPVLAGIGHEKDISLLGLVADKMVSTPTAAAQALNESWQFAATKLEGNKEKMFSTFMEILAREQNIVDRSFYIMREGVQSIFKKFQIAEQSLKRGFTAINSRIGELERLLGEYPSTLTGQMRTLIKSTDAHLNKVLDVSLAKMEYAIRSLRGLITLDGAIPVFQREINHIKQGIAGTDKLLTTYDPCNQLRLGYSIVTANGAVLKNIDDIKPGELVDVRLLDGTFNSTVKTITKNK